MIREQPVGDWWAGRWRPSVTGTWRRLRSARGQALVEFAIVLPVLLLILTAILQFGLMFNKYLSITDAVRTGARTLALGRGLSDPCDPAVSQTVNSAVATGLTASEVTPTLTSPDTCGTGTYPNRTGGSEAQGDEATVSATYPYTVSVFGMPLFSFNLSASASDEIE
jgi:Flp pilus assembly protein TadG